MSIIKEEARKIIDNMPEQATWDDIMYQFYVKKKIMVSLKAAEDGNIISHEDVKKEVIGEMNIHWTEPAVLDLESVRDYIARDSEYYAAEFVGRIVNAVENLCILPSMGRRVPEIDDRKIREIIFKSYRIIYQLDEEKEKLLVLAIIHAARDMGNIKPRPWEVI